MKRKSTTTPVTVGFSTRRRPAHTVHISDACTAASASASGILRYFSNTNASSLTETETETETEKEKEKEKGKSVTRRVLPSIVTPNVVSVYTDGSCVNNGKKCAVGGIGVYFGPRDTRNVSERITRGKITNQTMELEACIRGVQVALDTRDGSGQTKVSVNVFTDSEYVVKSINVWAKDWERKGWRTRFGGTVSNLVLIKRLYDLKNAHGHFVRLEHVPAHRLEPPPGSALHAHWKGNKAADELATRATREGGRV